MARTKQIANRPTGGSAKRRIILPTLRVPRTKSSVSRSTSRSPQSTPDVEMGEADTGTPLPPSPAPAGPAGVFASNKVGDAGGGTSHPKSDECESVSHHQVCPYLHLNLLSKWCHLCNDGGDILTICDGCGAATCERCIPALGTVPKPQLEECTFKCVRCTSKRTIFHVSVLLVVYICQASPTFIGIIQTRWFPPLSTWNDGCRPPPSQPPEEADVHSFPCHHRISSGAAAPGWHCWPDASSLPFTDLYDESRPAPLSSGPFQHQWWIKGSGPPPSDDEEGSERVADEVHYFFSKVLPSHTKLFFRNFDHAIIILQTHSDPGTGDLWFTSYDDVLKGPASTPIGNVCIFSHPTGDSKPPLKFFDAVIGPDMIEYIKGMKFSAFFLLACGAVVREKSALDGLEAIVKRYALQFNLISSLTWLPV